MSHAGWAAIAALAAACCACGADPKISGVSGPLSPPACAVLVIEHLPEDATPDWDVPSAAWSRELADGNALLVNAMPGSTVTVKCRLLTVDGRRIRKRPLEPITITWTGGQPPPSPPPAPPGPGPAPPSPPAPPKPDPAVDAALADALAKALAADIAAGQGTAAHAAALAGVYADGAALLELGDPAARPATVEALYAACAANANARGIPPPPYLPAVRALAGRDAPRAPPADPIAKHRDALIAWFRRTGAALAVAAGKGG